MNRLPLLLPLLLTGCIVVDRPASRTDPVAPVVHAAPQISTPPAQYAEQPARVTAQPDTIVRQPAPPQVVYVAPAPEPARVIEYPPLPEAEIVIVYEDVLGRRPTDRELRDWRSHTRRVRMSTSDVRQELRGTEEFRTLAPEAVIRRAYRDFHRREPDTDGMRHYRRLMIDDGWSAGRVRQSIAHDARASRPDDRGERDRSKHRDEDRRHTREHDEREAHSWDAIIDRAYDDLLERKPDPVGRDRYRRLLQQGRSEAEIRAQIKESVEYRVTLPDSKTTRAYREVLGREPDPVGLEGFRHKIVDKRWTEEDVKKYLRETDEYKKRNR